MRIACLLSRSVNHVNSHSPDLPNDLFRVMGVKWYIAAPQASLKLSVNKWMNLLGAWEPKDQRPIIHGYVAYFSYLPLLSE